MNFDNQPTIQLPQQGGAAPIIRTTDTTPAIQALMEATRQGAIDFDTINSHFAQGAKQAAAIDAMGTASVKDRQERELLPQIQALKKKTLELEAQVQPQRDELTKAKLGQELFDVRQKKLAQPTEEAATVTGLLAKQRDVSGLQSVLDKYPTGDQPDVYRAYLATGQPVPRLANNEPDFTTMRQQLGSIQETKLRSATGKELDAEGIKRQVIRAPGELDTAYAQRVFAEPAPLDAEGLGKVKQSIRASIDAIPKLEEALKYVNDPVTEPVGAKHSQGSKFNQALTGVEAGFGFNTEKNRQQAFLRNTLASQIQSTIQQLAGTGNRVMKAEVDPDTGLFYKAMPALDADKATWNSWIAEKKALFERAKDEQVASLPKSERTQYAGTPGTVTPPAPAAAAAPVAGRPPGVNDQGIIPPSDPVFQIQSKVAVPWPGIAGMNALQPGQPYFDHRGNLRIKGNK